MMASSRSWISAPCNFLWLMAVIFIVEHLWSCHLHWLQDLLRLLRTHPSCSRLYQNIRYFGTNRAGSNLVVPDDIDGLPATIGSLDNHLVSNREVLFYEAETGHGKAFRCFRFSLLCIATLWGIAYLLTKSIFHICGFCKCDEAWCWVWKEYST